MNIGRVIPIKSRNNPSEAETAATRLNLNYHKMDMKELKESLLMKNAASASFLNDLNIEADRGLRTLVAEKLLLQNGKNVIKTSTMSSAALVKKILQNFFTGFMALMWLAFLFSILLYRPFYTDPTDYSNLLQAIVIFMIIIISGVCTSYQDFSTLKAMRSFKNLGGSNRACVLRDGGKKMEIPASDLVLGDIVLLKNGQRVPADCRLIEADNLKLDKSMLTGESEPINATSEKYASNDPTLYTEAANIAFMTSLIISGKGKGVVIAVGGRTMISSISQITEANELTNKSTMLQRELLRFSIMIVIASLITCLIAVVVWAAWLRNINNVSSNIVYLIALIIGFLISYIPFGLPLVLTLALILDTQKLRRLRILVKNLTAVETLSSVNVIASDKTGTLTQNKMTVAGLTCGLMDVHPDACFTESTVYMGEMAGIKQLLTSSYICNNAKLSRDVQRGNATDIALYKFARTNMNVFELSRLYKIKCEVKFNSRNKYHSIVLEPRSRERHGEIFGYEKNFFSNLMIVKGAFDVLIRKCSSTITSYGNEIQLTVKDVEKLTKLNDYWCSMGRRCILVCKRSFSEYETNNKLRSIEEYFDNEIFDLCVLGLFSLIDPPKEGMYDVIQSCRKAGIRIMMITGDFSVTATSISQQVGLFTKGRTLDTLSSLRTRDVYRKKDNYFSMSNHVENKEENAKKKKWNGSISLTGKDLDMMNKTEWNIICNYYDEIIISRTTPEHKLKVIREFQSHGYIIGMTGDGLNDAPALKSANIGIAMGNGNEVAIEASHLVLLDNCFSSITKAIENGRLVFENLRKVILFLLPACVFCEVVSSILSTFFGTPSTINSYMMIILCILTDMFPALSLIFEKGECELMKRPSRSNQEKLVSFLLIFHSLFFVGLLTSLFSNFIFFWLMWSKGISPNHLFFCFSNWQDGYLGFSLSTLNAFLAEAQSANFLSIVIIQSLGNLFTIRTRHESLLATFPLKRRFRNYWLFAGAGLSLTIAFLLVYLPMFNAILGTTPVKDCSYILASILFSLILILLDEMRKFFIRKTMKK